MDPQLKRGLLEVCVLSVLRSEESYGYRIIKDLSGIIDISESTLYPILKRLESGGYLIAFSREHNGRLRRYYQITEAGEERIKSFLAEWKTVMDVYHFIINGGFYDDKI